TFAQALEAGDPEHVIEEVRAAGLAGRGGAYFPTATKWRACRDAAGAPKFVIVNGEEGEPGIFKDRHLMEGDPHRLLEGLLLAAFAVGASRAILYVHGEADLAAARLSLALSQASEWGLVGTNVLGSGFRTRGRVPPGRGRLGARRGDGVLGVDRRRPRDAAHAAAVSRRGRALGKADRDQQRRDAVRRAHDPRAWRRLVRGNGSRPRH